MILWLVLLYVWAAILIGVCTWMLITDYIYDSGSQVPNWSDAWIAAIIGLIWPCGAFVLLAYLFLMKVGSNRGY